MTDYGIQIELHKLGYMQCTSNRMLLEPAAVVAAEKAFAADHPQAVFTYLANTIASGGTRDPLLDDHGHRFVAEPPLGPFKTPDGQTIGPLADDEIVLNSWAADDLGVEPGDEVEITYLRAREHARPSARSRRPGFA